MTSKYDTYTSPLAERNASPEMLRLWSARHKFNTWRRIWLAVAEAQHALTRPTASDGDDQAGRPPVMEGSQQPDSPVDSSSFWRYLKDGPPLVTSDQVEELRAVVERPGGITDDELRLAEKYERELRHDVMAHVHALGDSCPKARGIIHLGMTSQDVVCNADYGILRDAFHLIDDKINRCLIALGKFAMTHRATPALGFTHFQPAQPVTVGRRAAQWTYELELSWRGDKWSRSSWLQPRGIRGATGTQAAMLNLVGGESGLVTQMETHAMQLAFTWDVNGEPLPSRGYYSGFDFHTLTSQTYPRVVDCFILSDLAAVAAVLHKIATDIRLLCNRKELDEPFEDKQIGSSAMPYKRNPMRCERICGLTRFVMNLVGNAYDTAATQWLERTLDDSSNRRLSLPEAFLALDGALDLMHNVASGLIVHEAMVRKNLMAELPFMATENILMECVKLGGDRQEFHEIIRAHAQTAGLRVKDEGLDNDLIDRLKNDKAFWPASRGGTHGLRGELNWGDADPNAPPGTGGLLDPMKYIGRSIEQTERFIKEVVEPLREQYGEAIERLEQSGPRV